MHIWAVNISKMVTDRAITIAIKYQAEHGLSISVFQFDLGDSKGQLGSWNGVSQIV